VEEENLGWFPRIKSGAGVNPIAAARSHDRVEISSHSHNVFFVKQRTTGVSSVIPTEASSADPRAG
jgi:hypothetical protein